MAGFSRPIIGIIRFALGLLTVGLTIIAIPYVIARVTWNYVTRDESDRFFDQDTINTQIHVEELPKATKPVDDLAEHSQTLSEQQRWGELSDLIKRLDTERAQIGGEQLTTIAVQGACQKMHDALPDHAAAEQELNLLDLAHSEASSDPYLAMVAARAHYDMAWAIRGGDWAQNVPDDAWDGYFEHLQRAHAISAKFDPIALNSPLVASINHFLARESDEGLPPLEQAFRKAMALDPCNWSLMSDHAFYLLPRWHGDAHSVEQAARDQMTRTQDATGAAAYAAFQMGVLDRDEDALLNVDIDLLSEGLCDLLDHGGRDIIHVNKVLSWCFDLSWPHTGLFGNKKDKLLQQRSRDMREIAHHILRAYFTAHVPDAWPEDRETVRQFVAKAHASDFKDGAMISVSREEGITISRPE